MFHYRTIVALVVFSSVFASNLVAQDHFIGEDQAVNRVIRLESKSDKPVARVAKKVTSRVVQEKRATSAVTNPSLVKFDEISVPRALQQPMKPVVRQQAPQVQATPTKTSNSFTRPASFPMKSRPSTTATKTKTTKVTPLVTKVWQLSYD